MFEGIVISLLRTFIGEYIEDIKEDDMTIGVLKGEVLLKNLAMRAGALDFLELPVTGTSQRWSRDLFEFSLFFTVVKGFIGEIKLKIPFSNMETQPSIVQIERVYCVIKTRFPGIKQTASELAESIIQQLNFKMKQLASHELKLFSPKEVYENVTFSSLSLRVFVYCRQESKDAEAGAGLIFLQQFLENLQLRISRVTLGGQPYVLSLVFFSF